MRLLIYLVVVTSITASVHGTFIYIFFAASYLKATQLDAIQIRTTNQVFCSGEGTKEWKGNDVIIKGRRSLLRKFAAHAFLNFNLAKKAFT